ncbi:MAG TPA: AI-2E family transporter [Candidatus Saccharimonadales bacterium]|nr:AI-2E family transporter [Candidatus Saccharimonadales bacterium]
MTIRLRTAFFIGLILLVTWFLYIERAILTPFVVAAIFAYILSPIVNFFSQKIKLPRTLSVFIVYFLIMGLVVVLATILTQQVFHESQELKNYSDNIVRATRQQVDTLPDFARPTANELIVSLNKSKILSPAWFIAIFPQAISRIISFLIFLFSTFYFLKEGRNIFDKLLLFVPNDYKIEFDILTRKINSVLGGYLRGQFFLIIFVSAILFVALSVLGIRFALIIAIFSGFAEIVPIVGPFAAGAVASMVAFATGSNNFSLTPVQSVIAVAIIYFALRQIEDYFVAPHIMGKITRIHPFIIFFAVLAGGHLMGVLGLILAVPVAGIIRILLEYCLDKVNQRSHPAHHPHQ